MTPPTERPSTYIPSVPAGFVAVLLSLGIVVLALRDSFTTDYDARQTIVVFAVLIGGTLGFDFRRGRWKDEPPPPPVVKTEPGELEP